MFLNHNSEISGLVRSLLFFACGIVVLMAAKGLSPGTVRAQTEKAARTQSTSTSVSTMTEGATTVEIKMKGQVDLTDDDADVKAISPDGYLSITEKEGATTTKRFEVMPSALGGILRRYAERGRERELDATARQWLKGVLSRSARESPVWAAARVERILSRNGVEGVLQEITLIKSDYVKRLYQQKLLELKGYGAEVSAKVMTQAAEKLSSEYERAELLLYVARNVTMGATAGARRAFFQTLDAIGSDYERRRVLDAVVEGQSDWKVSSDTALLADAFRSASRLTSEYELAQFLIGYAARRKIDDAVRPFFIAALNKIKSDYERGRVQAALNGSEKRP